MGDLIRLPLHDKDDLRASWRVWFYRREHIIRYMQGAYPYIAPHIIRQMVMGVELWATCNDDLFKTHIELDSAHVA